MWLDAPASSSLPHFEGHHGLSVPFGRVAVCASAAVIGASENLPCTKPASAAPAAPASPAVRSKVRRSVCIPLGPGARDGRDHRYAQVGHCFEKPWKIIGRKLKRLKSFGRDTPLGSASEINSLEALGA